MSSIDDITQHMPGKICAKEKPEFSTHKYNAQGWANVDSGIKDQRHRS